MCPLDLPTKITDVLSKSNLGQSMAKSIVQWGKEGKSRHMVVAREDNRLREDFLVGKDAAETKTKLPRWC